ncbi:hypothetical protein Ciccas_005341 [Cichlidogyrus casuarinus]|uniref:AIP/AIPL N-terminal FKBP-type PPIase domain-containing protein n=1 Tax=Cichlidogyrus casuarinus TaxID=1844966 RepID=A0ABD2Q8X8_9PLAT
MPSSTDDVDCCHGHKKHDGTTKMAELLCEKLAGLRSGEKEPALDDSWMRNIQKRLLHVGSGFPLAESCQRAGGGYEYPPETKFVFHYQIKTVEPAAVVVMDDTKKYGKSMELYSGKKFQLEFWEYCLSTMALNEVAVFRVPPERLLNFAPVNKKLRDYMLGKTAAGTASHCCGGMLAMQESVLGYDDLNHFLKNPQALDFVFELLSVVLPEEKKKDSWILNDGERLARIPELREQGNANYVAGHFEEAQLAYKQALDLLEQLILREKPQEPEWLQINAQMVPFFVNLAQTQFKLEDYYGAVDSCNQAIQRDPNNIKALFRRAQAFGKIWEIDSALRDYERVIGMQPSMAQAVHSETVALKQLYKDQRDKEKNLLSSRLKPKQ